MQKAKNRRKAKTQNTTSIYSIDVMFYILELEKDEFVHLGSVASAGSIRSMLLVSLWKLYKAGSLKHSSQQNRHKSATISLNPKPLNPKPKVFWEDKDLSHYVSSNPSSQNLSPNS